MARKVVISVVFGLVFGWSPVSRGADVEVKVEGLRSSDGSIRYSLFGAAEGYPQDGSKAVRKGSAPIAEKASVFQIKDLTPGPYAISVIHDENNNEKLDTGLFGIPTEGIGASNNAKGSFGPPKFEDARFDVGAKGATQVIKIMHIF